MGYNYRREVIYFGCFIDYYTHVKVFYNVLVSVLSTSSLQVRVYYFELFHITSREYPQLAPYDWYHSSLFLSTLNISQRKNDFFFLVDTHWWNIQNEFLVNKYLIETGTGGTLDNLFNYIEFSFIHTFTTRFEKYMTDTFWRTQRQNYGMCHLVKIS